MKTHNEIAIVDKLEKLSPCLNFGLTKDISVIIGKLDEHDNKPRNFSVSFDTPKTSNGGCFARIFASEYGTGSNSNIFSWYGPSMSFPDMQQYRHGLRAMERIAKRMDAMHKDRGASVDAADAMGRWIEATGVTKVYLRPDCSRSERWLSKGEWTILTVGEFVNLARRNLYCAPIVNETAAIN